MISHISKFFILFIFVILFLSFKNEIKIKENELYYLKNNYIKDKNTYINKEILLSKYLNRLQITNLEKIKNIQYNKIIRFDRNEFDDFTIIKVNYVQSE